MAFNLTTGLVAALLLLAAHVDGQVRGATRIVGNPAQQSTQARYYQPANVYTGANGVVYPGQGVVSPAQGVAYPGQGVVYSAPNAAFPAANGVVYAGAQTQFQTVGRANGYAAPAQNQFQTVGGNGYAAPAPTQFQTASGGNGYSVPLQTVDPTALCDAKWSTALRREIMNPDDWICGSRTVAGAPQPCIITGPSSASVFKNLSMCGWKIPTFCDNTVADLMTSLNKPSSTSSTTSSATIPADYTLIAGAGYYKVHTEPLSWDAAKTACELEAPGAHLAIPSTAAEYTGINDLVNSLMPTQFLGAYVGVSDTALEGTFVTVTGQPICMLGQVQFQPGQPDDYQGKEDCGAISWNRGALLNDFPCEAPLPFVCELPLPGSTIAC